MGVSGRNFPASAKGVAVDLYDASALTDPAIGGTMHPFASAWGAGIQQTNAAKTETADAVAWNLMYIGQEAELQTKFGVGCLSQAELEDIGNANRRENTPQNCAKLNGKAHPYFDAGVVNIKAGTGATEKTGKTYAFFSSRNNNFSNRDQTMNICVRKEGAGGASTCKPNVAGAAAGTNAAGDPINTKNALTGMPDPLYNPFASDTNGGVELPDGIVQQEPPADEPPLEEATTAPIEKDNDAIGSGEQEACEARVDMFLRSIGLWGIIAIACACIALGILGTLVFQACYGRMKTKNQWHQQEGHKV